MNTKRNLLFITEKRSKFDSHTSMFSILFNRADVNYFSEWTPGDADSTLYDIVIGDLSVDPEQVGVLKQIKEGMSNAIIFAMVDPKDSEKLYKIADMGINAFELLPEQFDMALEEIARFEPENTQS